MEATSRVPGGCDSFRWDAQSGRRDPLKHRVAATIPVGKVMIPPEIVATIQGIVATTPYLSRSLLDCPASREGSSPVRCTLDHPSREAQNPPRDCRENRVLVAIPVVPLRFPGGIVASTAGLSRAPPGRSASPERSSQEPVDRGAEAAGASPVQGDDLPAMFRRGHAVAARMTPVHSDC